MEERDKKTMKGLECIDRLECMPPLEEDENEVIYQQYGRSEMEDEIRWTLKATLQSYKVMCDYPRDQYLKDAFNTLKEELDVLFDSYEILYNVAQSDLVRMLIRKSADSSSSSSS